MTTPAETTTFDETPLLVRANAEHAGGALSMQNGWPTNPDGTPKTKKGWPGGMAPGECKQVPGSRGDIYTMKHCLNGGGLACDCPSWCYQPGVFPKLPGMARTCKHLDAAVGALEMQRHIARGLEALGEEFVPKCERPEVVAERAAKRARGETMGDLHKPFKRQSRPAEGEDVERLKPPEDNGFFGKDSFALAFDLQGQPVEGYWASEKLDGVRAYWDGYASFWSRNGNKFKVPAEVSAMMPLGMPLDGELWGGRGTFQQTNGFLKRSNTVADEWYARHIKFMVFDAPFADGNYETRMAKVRSHMGANIFAQPVHSEKVTDEAAMRSRARIVAEAGGEGLMLREPHGVYRPDRTCDLLKVVDKLFTEAMIVGHNPGEGRLADCTGSLQCKLRSGMTFAVGSGMVEAERRNPPATGTIVVVQYKGLTNAGAPRQPTYKGVCTRIDVDESQFQTTHPCDLDTEEED